MGAGGASVGMGGAVVGRRGSWVGVGGAGGLGWGMEWEVVCPCCVPISILPWVHFK